jgi:secreted trypsin-like serine protease
MRLRLPVVALLITGSLALSGGTAFAITNGSPDGNAHPEVGALISATQYSDGTWAYCSGTLVSPTVFVTAAHCDDNGARTRVSFSTAYKAGDKTYAGNFRSDPGYTGVQSDPHDLAVVVLDQAVKGIRPATLPRAGFLDSELKAGRLQTSRFTPVGYGANQVAPGGKSYYYDDVRMKATGSFNSLQTAWLRLSMNASTGNGGTCYGDSGGPNSYGGDSSHLLVVTTMTGDAVCRLPAAKPPAAQGILLSNPLVHVGLCR